MGLFDKLGPRRSEFSPSVALGAALIYLSAAEGRLDDDEVVILARLLPDPETLDASIRYAGRQSFDDFLVECRATLTPGQRHCILLNVVDFALHDGALTTAEEQRIRTLIDGFGFTENDMSPAVDALIIKNDRSVLSVRHKS